MVSAPLPEERLRAAWACCDSFDTLDTPGCRWVEGKGKGGRWGWKVRRDQGDYMHRQARHKVRQGTPTASLPTLSFHDTARLQLENKRTKVAERQRQKRWQHHQQQQQPLPGTVAATSIAAANHYGDGGSSRKHCVGMYSRPCDSCAPSRTDARAHRTAWGTGYGSRPCTLRYKLRPCGGAHPSRSLPRTHMHMTSLNKWAGGSA